MQPQGRGEEEGENEDEVGEWHEGGSELASLLRSCELLARSFSIRWDGQDEWRVLQSWRPTAHAFASFFFKSSTSR